MPPNTTIWALEPHTKGKHLVLRKYMDAWLPIMTRSNSNVLFIDAFAGPGVYEGGEDGSPVIALRAFIDHHAKSRIVNDVIYLFIEKDADRYRKLREVIDDLRLKDELPNNCEFWIVNSSFDSTLKDELDKVDEQSERLAPCFVMIDPFGVSDTPMSIIARILSNPKSEVYISFMYEAINRFISLSEFEPHLDELFGSHDWVQCRSIQETSERRRLLYELYENRLRNAGAEYVLHFDLYEGNRLIYVIFFGTHSLVGCDKMKHAIWDAMSSGDYAFRGGQDVQLSFNPEITDFTGLGDALRGEFGYDQWVDIKTVEDFVKSDKVRFHSGHLRVKTLRPMEDRGVLEARHATRDRRRGTYPSGTEIRFVERLAPPQLDLNFK